MPNVQTQTLDAAGPIFSFILGGIPPVTGKILETQYHRRYI